MTGWSRQRQDYMECLHHKKEITRINTIAKELQRQRDEAAKVYYLTFINAFWKVNSPHKIVNLLFTITG